MIFIDNLILLVFGASNFDDSSTVISDFCYVVKISYVIFLLWPAQGCLDQKDSIRTYSQIILKMDSTSFVWTQS